ncbi:hypothetical protein Ga0100231_013035 [Opitutaceae bacterium TAV4]|uniref:hypothetical protein n=1 Tax=Geminisphaera colitermitum TaxID=1148786 RepID=UPI0005BABF0B|nr:hypothetical protein [Geminisphaera colitermitum]RRJ95093.1 hypothetical protein Ga0100231_013035 [Opitutaceae bacterium TAV4]RRJ99350.1 hypothetical protein Ga0100230_014330 [Opitutaceae bacterium TAV3]
MSDYNTDGTFDNSWDDRGDVVWNEFDWEQYLREQDEVLLRYIACYEKLRNHPQRLDETARLMGWDIEEWSGETETNPETAKTDTPQSSSSSSSSGAANDAANAAASGPAAAADSPFASDATSDDDNSASAKEDGDLIPDMSDDMEPYTLQKNPVFVATRAIYLSLTRSWERLAADPAKVPQPFAIGYMGALQRGETQSLLAIQALDFGDYALAISLLKRALLELNATMGRLGKVAELGERASKPLRAYCAGAMSRLFDLREIWLRVMSECRYELAYPSDDDYDDEDEEDDED